MLSRFNLALAITLALVFVLLILFRVDNSRPNYQVHLGDDMSYSPAFTSFETNHNFANGRTLQDPVPGTIARGAQTFHFDATPQGANQAGEQLRPPFDIGTEEYDASAKRGQVGYQTFCAACHGGDGTGNGPVAKRGFPPPPSLLTGKSREMKDGQLFHILTYGQNSMPQFAAQLWPQRRWDVINYIRQLQRETQPPVVKQETTPTSQASQIVQPGSVTPLGLDAESQP
ncbi:MAG: cytochrome c [Pirellulales bacterium]|nr:cytochrome c [Pirellulales bacterium]